MCYDHRITKSRKMMQSCFRHFGLRAQRKVSVCNGLLGLLSAFIPAWVQLCEASTLCVFRPIHFLELAAAWPVIKFHWPSTIMMKWRPVMLAPLISVTLVAHTSTAVRGPSWPLASGRLATTRWPWCEGGSEYIFDSSHAVLFSVYIFSEMHPSYTD